MSDTLESRIRSLDRELLRRKPVAYVTAGAMERALRSHGFLGEDPTKKEVLEAVSVIHDHGMQARNRQGYGLLIFDHIYPDLTFGYHVCRIGRYA